MKRRYDDEVLLPAHFLAKHTTDFEKAAHFVLRIDPSLIDVMTLSAFPAYLNTKAAKSTLDDYFNTLASGILSQQISCAAASAVKGRLVALFSGQFPTFQQLKELFEAQNTKGLRGCGISERKVGYIGSLTNYFSANPEHVLHLFKHGSDQEIVDELVAKVKGIGPWSAKMFLVTGLNHQDVFAADDLGIARGCSKYLMSRPAMVKDIISKRKKVKKSRIIHKKQKWKVYDEDIVELCGDLFRPYRTLFMFILWRLASTSIDAMVSLEAGFVGDAKESKE